MAFFSPSTQSSDCLVFTWLFFFPCFSCRYAPLRRPIHQVTHHPESVSGCLYFPEKSAQFCTAPRCLAACPPHFALRGSKFQIRGVTDQRAEPPLSSGSILLFSVRLEWQCQVSPNRWVWQSGWPGAQTQSCSKPPPEILKTNVKKKKTLSSVDYAAELRFSSLSSSVFGRRWEQFKEDTSDAGLVKQPETKMSRQVKLQRLSSPQCLHFHPALTEQEDSGKIHKALKC